MSNSPNVEEAWSPEPELRELPPRRVVSSEFPDLNRPNMIAFLGGGGGGALVGIIAILAFQNVFVKALGIVLLLGGLALLALYPQKMKKHADRSRHLVENATPVLARIVAVTNMTGDSQFGRSVRYQVTLPGGEILHRDVNADDRALPKIIPGNVTALMDMHTTDVELYCVLPFRAYLKPQDAMTAPRPQSALDDIPTAPPTGAGGMGQMGNIGMGGIGQQQSQGQTQQTPPASGETQPAKPGYQGLPWE